MISETGEQLGVFTSEDRRMLREVHAMLDEVRPYLDYLPALARLADNPVLRWKTRKEPKGG